MKNPNVRKLEKTKIQKQAAAALKVVTVKVVAVTVIRTIGICWMYSVTIHHYLCIRLKSIMLQNLPIILSGIYLLFVYYA